jgi:4-hydroxysphinganine ceramide fatty acyl 2-hydroxylase
MGEASPRLFQADWMELCSRTRWYHVALLPLLAISYMAWNIDTWSSLNPGNAALAIAAGVLSLTLFEYLLHRFVFHAEQWLPDVKLLRMAHFFMHGIHHMLPFDP